jgi:hypothetical protein
MRVHLKRHGIVIHTVPVSGERAAIGSAKDSDLVIDDPYVAPHVADLVLRDGEWRIVDAGTSLEGLTRDGERIDDEPVVFDHPYLIGGYELLIEGTGSARPGVVDFQTTVLPLATLHEGHQPAMPASPPAASATPHVPPATATRAPEPVRMTRIGSAPPAAATNTASPAASDPRRRILIIAGVAFGALFLLILLSRLVGGGAAPPTIEEQPTVVETAEPQPVAPPADRVREGERMLANLDYSRALELWEPQLRSGDQALRSRYITIAMELSRAYAAAGDLEQARLYGDKAAAAAAVEAEPATPASTP